MSIKTKITEMLGIEHPIVMGGMHFVGYAELAAAVSNAGGLGCITALTQPTPELLRTEIQKCRKLTDKPFAVNLTLLPALKPPNYDDYIKVIIEEGIKIVETAGRNPESVIPKFKAANIIVIHKCVSPRHALTAQRLGADIISMDGLECAGHPGENDVGNWILANLAQRKLKIPFIVSGGCATGRQLAASLAFGAQGFNLGTRLMATKESNIHDNIKQALVDGDETSTMLVLRSLKNTERVYKNDTAKKVASIEASNPGDLGAIIHLIKGEKYRLSFQSTGDTQSSVWSCGQSIALIDSIPTVQQLFDDIIAECVAAIRETASTVVNKDGTPMLKVDAKL